MISFPDVQWIQNDIATDPSGARHLNTTGYVKTLGTNAGGALSFGSINITVSGAISDTALVFAHVNSLGDASGVFNMRFFLNKVSAWNTGTYRFLFDKNIHFIANYSLNNGHNDVPTTIPTSQNILSTLIPGWTDGAPYISGISDQGVTEYIWLAVLAGTNVPIGTYGGAGAGTFRYRLLYDFS